jgi:arylsulfatase A-like enzyme
MMHGKKGGKDEHTEIPRGTYEVDYLRNLTETKIKEWSNGTKEQDQPWFITVSWKPPHEPFIGPPSKQFVPMGKYLPNVDDAMAKQAMPGYFASVSELDSQFGKLLDVTDKTEKSRGRIVVFTADHGYQLGSHGWMDKGVLWEEATRIPLLIRMPKSKKPKASTFSAAIANYDLGPTLLGLAGVKGRARAAFDTSLAAVAKTGGAGQDLSTQILYNKPDLNRFVTLDCGCKNAQSTWRCGVVSQFWKLTGAPQSNFQSDEVSLIASKTNGTLFDLKADPFELKPLNGGNAPDMVREAYAKVACSAGKPPFEYGAWQDIRQLWEYRASQRLKEAPGKEVAPKAEKEAHTKAPEARAEEVAERKAEKAAAAQAKMEANAAARAAARAARAAP